MTGLMADQGKMRVDASRASCPDLNPCRQSKLDGAKINYNWFVYVSSRSVFCVWNMFEVCEGEG